MPGYLSISTNLYGLHIFNIPACGFHLWNFVYSLIFLELFSQSRQYNIIITCTRTFYYSAFYGIFTTDLLKLFLQDNSNVYYYYLPYHMDLSVIESSLQASFISFEIPNIIIIDPIIQVSSYRKNIIIGLPLYFRSAIIVRAILYGFFEYYAFLYYYSALLTDFLLFDHTYILSRTVSSHLEILDTFYVIIVELLLIIYGSLTNLRCWPRVDILNYPFAGLEFYIYHGFLTFCSLHTFHWPTYLHHLALYWSSMITHKPLFFEDSTYWKILLEHHIQSLNNNEGTLFLKLNYLEMYFT